MHNLYLGTGKHAFKVWVNKGLLGSNELNEIDRRTRLFYVPPGICRLPINFSSNFGGFKADQWRSWITIYSPVVLKGVLPNERTMNVHLHLHIKESILDFGPHFGVFHLRGIMIPLALILPT